MAGLSKTARGESALAGVAQCEAELETALKLRLEVAEERLRESIAEARDARVERLAGHVVVSGGKRLRPLLVLLGAEFGERDRPTVVDAAVIMELIHAASLCHDDVMDQATTRRGLPSVNAVYGNASAVRAGNWLLAKAGQLASGLGEDGLRLHSRVTERLVQGQLHELIGPTGGVDALTHYFTVISGKSASLISVSLQLGAAEAAAPPGVAEALGSYGEHLGLAFQISDDLLDVTSETSVSGKEQGKDLAAGVTSLPVLLALADHRPKGRKLRDLLASGRPATPREHRRLLALLRASEVMTESRTLMHEHLTRARTALADLPPGPALTVLDTLCDFVARRDR